MDKLSFILGFHAHQPIGNFDWVYEEAYEKSYKPFLDILERHPRIKTTLHYSGCLIDWFTKSKPEFLKRVRSLVKAGQVELLGGGYYEPILPLISDDDKKGELALMRDAIKRHFNVTPKGIWLAERVWEPQIAKFLSDEGVKYTIVDDSHFRRSGLAEDKIFGYYVTEDDGSTLAVFPTLEKLRYMMPFKLPDVAIDYLRACKETTDGAVVIADDTEKFGLWPGTYKWVYEEGWLDNFFKKIEENGAWIETMTFSEYLSSRPPLGRVYLACGSYKEMDEWSGGYFRNFLMKYPESNHLHKKMLYVSERLKKAAGRVPADIFKEARRNLYMAQCNDVYWHGVFGGLYLNHLRYAAYNHLLEAEAILESADKSYIPNASIFDFDKDGCADAVMDGKSLGLVVDLDKGGSVTELDYKPARINLVNTLSRRPEPYHNKLKEPQEAKAQAEGASPATIHEGLRLKENGLSEYLNYDWYRKASLIDHFMPQETSYEEFSKCKFRELGDFVNMPYSAKVKNRTQANKADIAVILSRDGNIREDAPQQVSVSKIIAVADEPRLEIKYIIKNSSSRLLKVLFGVEFNFSLKDPHFNQPGAVQDIKRIDINDQWSGIRIDFAFERPAGLWHFPIETVSESESGIERTYQELTFLFNWKLELSPGSAWKAGFSAEFTET